MMLQDLFCTNLAHHELESDFYYYFIIMIMMLQESLGGNAKTSLVIAVANAEDHLDESMQSLQFGSRAMRIMTRAVVNERVDVKVDIAPEILAELEQKEDQANALALSLMAKENELEQAQGDLKVTTIAIMITALSIMTTIIITIMIITIMIIIITVWQ